MPIYEYICKECKKSFETLVTSSASQAPISCRHCGSSNTRKTISATSYRVSSASSGTSIPMGSGLSSGGCSSGSGFR